MHGDFAHGPEFLPDFIRRLERERTWWWAKRPSRASSRGRRMVRRFAPMLLRRAVRVEGLNDIVSGSSPSGS